MAGAVATLVVGATSAPAGGVMPNPSVALTDQDSGRTITLHVGQSCTVSLFENATAGYRWAIDSIDPHLLEGTEAASAYSSGAVGSGGRVAWTFIARAPGTTVLKMKLWRRWEGDSSITNRVSFTFDILP
jgi:inhibitor of cysteine peptidase